ncbi:TonB family protein [Sphingomonas montana]|uniref:TonB family protein n=1 Tax=Sphingomonas montana TaxID=1843236 RepID=UPI0009F9A508|nr:TonB family protein [Sphingomonas montana]
MTLARTLFALLVVQVPPPAMTPPHIVRAQDFPLFPSAAPTYDLVSFVPGPVRCDLAAVRPERVVTPFDTSTARYARPTGLLRPRPAAGVRMFDFAIDTAGRPVTIRQRPPAPEHFGDDGDLAPALAAWRFPAGAARTACTVGFAVTTTPIDRAPVASLARLLAGPTVGPAGATAFARLKPAGTTCYDPPRANVRSMNYPPFERFTEPNGDWNHIYLSYDINAAGKPVAVRTIASSGNAAFDAAARAALARNRYEPGVRSGCLMRYHSGSAPMPEPAASAAPVATKGPDCPADLRQVMTLPPGRPYPPGFMRRGITGSATVRFDVASWGKTGNVTVLTAEPAEAFGRTARMMIEQATIVPSPSGYRGCVSTVRFRLPDRGDTAAPGAWLAPD